MESWLCCCDCCCCSEDKFNTSVNGFVGPSMQPTRREGALDVEWFYSSEGEGEGEAVGGLWVCCVVVYSVLYICIQGEGCW